MVTSNKIKQWLKHRMVETESALIVGWFDFSHLLVVIGLFMVVFGAVIDPFWSHMHANTTIASGLYTQADRDAFDDIYNLFGNVPVGLFFVGLGVLYNHAQKTRGQ